MQKQLKPLLLILIVLTVWLGFRTYWPKIRPAKSEYLTRSQSLKQDEVKTIKLVKKDETLELNQEGGVWKVNSKKADKNKLNDILNVLMPETAPELVATLDTKHQELELTPDLGTEIKLNNQVELIVGKQAVNGGVYVRYKDDQKSYLISGLGYDLISLDPAFWYDKTIISADLSVLLKLTFNQNGKNTVLVKKEIKWVKETGGEEILQDKIDQAVTILGSFQAEELATESQIKTYKNLPDLILVIEFNTGKETLEFTQGKEDFLVKRMSDEEKFLVTSFTANKFLDLANSL